MGRLYHLIKQKFITSIKRKHKDLAGKSEQIHLNLRFPQYSFAHQETQHGYISQLSTGNKWIISGLQETLRHFMSLDHTEWYENTTRP